MGCRIVKVVLPNVVKKCKITSIKISVRTEHFKTIYKDYTVAKLILKLKHASPRKSVLLP